MAKNKNYKKVKPPLKAGLSEIHTTGHPRSGNTWLNRLLSDLLSSPLQIMPGEDIEYFGKKTDGDYVIRKKHILSDEKPQTGKIIFIQRDPRDVIVSAMYYRNNKPTPENLMRVMRTFCEPDANPKYKIYHNMGTYERFIRSWMDTGLADVNTKYERLHHTPLPELRRIGLLLTGINFGIDWIAECYERQRFDNWKDDYHHSMRKGIVGDWKKYFRKDHGEYITKHLGQLMIEQKYIDDLDWWKEISK